MMNNALVAPRSSPPSSSSSILQPPSPRAHGGNWIVPIPLALFLGAILKSRLQNFDPLPLSAFLAKIIEVKGSAKMQSPGSVKFVPAVAYQFCLALPAEITQPGDHLLEKPCT